MKKKFFDVIQVVMIFLIFILGLFIVYHIIRKILGGSLGTEDIIIALLVFNLSCVFIIILNLARLNSDHHHLEK